MKILRWIKRRLSPGYTDITFDLSEEDTKVLKDIAKERGLLVDELVEEILTEQIKRRSNV
jgi:hypothetical protein